MLYNKEEVFGLLKKLFGKFDEVLIPYSNLNDDAEDPFCFSSCFDTFQYAQDDTYDKNFGDIEFGTGATKFVIIPENADYVIKLPITGIYEYTLDTYHREILDYAYMHNVDITFDDNDVDVVILSNNSGMCDEEIEDMFNRMKQRYEQREDYELIAHYTSECLSPFEDENNMYKNADDDMKKIMLPNIFIGEFNGIPVYIQKKAISLNHSDKFRHLSRAEKDSVSKVISSSLKEKDYGYNYCPVAFCFFSDVIEFYGEKMAEKIARFLDKADDLHDGNIGYVGEQPILIDYGGYKDESAYWIFS